MTSNIFEVVIGRGVLKWDAVWRVIEWLTSPSEGHGLGDRFQQKLGSYCLGYGLSPIEIAVEYHLGRDDTSTRHPDVAIAYPSLESPHSIALIDDLGNVSPNASRKVNNLIAYARLARDRFPDAERRIVVITDTTDETRFVKLNAAFKAEESATLSYLPLQVIGQWIRECGPSDSSPVNDFADWAESL